MVDVAKIVAQFDQEVVQRHGGMEVCILRAHGSPPRECTFCEQRGGKLLPSHRVVLVHIIEILLHSEYVVGEMPSISIKG